MGKSAAAQHWPADRVSRRPVSDLVPYAKNARTHSPEQVAALAASLKQWGWTNPVLVDEEGGIIAGHGRVLAAQALGMAEVPVMVATGWTDAQKRAYVIADNQLAIGGADWDPDLLAAELDALRHLKFDTSLMGFTPGELNELIGTPNTGFDPDEVPSAPVVPVSRTGDLWLLGAHRLLCGDSTKAEDVARLMGGEKADLCFASPPYANQREYGGTLGDWDTIMQGVFGALPMADGAQVLVNLGLVHRDCEWWPYWEPWIEWMRAQGWRRFGWYVWDQGFGLPGDWNGRLAPSHEFVFHFNREAERARKSKTKNAENVGVRKISSTMRKADGKTYDFSSPEASAQPNKIPDSVIRVTRQCGRISDDLDHPAVFPVALAEEIIAAFSDPGDVCYEPFAGAGSQILAAEKLGRKCRAMELTAAYVDVTCQRWAIVTGNHATLDADGRTFEEVKCERAQENTERPAPDRGQSVKATA